MMWTVYQECIFWKSETKNLFVLKSVFLYEYGIVCVRENISYEKCMSLQYWSVSQKRTADVINVNIQNSVRLTSVNKK
jgi:hypothetical protein